MILDSYKMLKAIEQRPAMFTGETSLRSIYIYFLGYNHALLDNQIINEIHTTDPFFDWVANKLGYYESTAGWANMIFAYSIGFKPRKINWNQVFEVPVSNEDHYNSIRLFYKLLEEFKEEMETRTP